MPASRKRRSAAKAGTPGLTAAVVPTRRQRDHYMETTSAAMRDAALEAADAVMARQVLNERSNGLIARAYKALTLSPLCVDAYAALSEETRDPAQAIDYLDRGIHAGGLALGGLDPADDAFWVQSQSMPTMNARIARAERLLDRDEGEGIAALRDVIQSDPRDRAAARIPLLQALLNQDDIQPARALLDQFPDDRIIDWLYGRLLAGYREEHRAGPAVLALMREALAINPHVPGIFAGDEPEERWPAKPGSPEEAINYDAAYGVLWDDEPGAVEWLIATAGTARDALP